MAMSAAAASQPKERTSSSRGRASIAVQQGEAIKALLEVAREFHSDDWEEEFVQAGIKSLFHYFNESKLGREEMGIMLSAYALDKRNHFSHLTEEAHQKILRSFLSLLK